MIIGTAGHVDHGKTLLVQRLTGVDTDRLAEEKQRGITIDLGFAYLPTPDGGVLGFIDVPGHERFIRTMVVGASAMSAAMLVVAANEGIRPQTVEHLQIIDLLGVDRGVVALNKSDLATPAEAERVEAEIRQRLRGTGLEGAEIVRVSALSGEGVDVLRRHLFGLADDSLLNHADRAFRLSIDRSFTLAGIGTVVTGTILSGAVSVGDELLIQPQGLVARVRSLRAQDRETGTASAGQRCALNLSGRGVSKDTIARGDWLVAPSRPYLTARFDAEMKLLATAGRPLKDGASLHVHVGASEVNAHAVILSGAAVEPGATAFAQFSLSRALPMRHGDRFILRNGSSRETIGGGRVLDIRAPYRRRRHARRMALLRASVGTEPVAALGELLDKLSGFVCVTDFAADRMLAPGEEARLVERLSLTTLRCDNRLYATTPANWDDLTELVKATLRDFHDRRPSDPGMAVDLLRKAIGWTDSEELMREAVMAMARDQIVVHAPPRVRLSSHIPDVPRADARLQALILELVSRDRLQPPRVHEMAAKLGVSEVTVRRLGKRLAADGALVEVAADRFFLRAAVGELAAAAKGLAEHSPLRTFTAADFRTEIGTGRTAAIQILEYFDRKGITMRSGDQRSIVRDPRLVLGETIPNTEENRLRWDVRTSNPGGVVGQP